MCYCEFPTIQVCVLISISLLLWQWACASAGDEPALHRFSLHAAHLGEVHTLLILHLMTFDPVIWLLNTLELDQTRIEQLYAHSSIFFPSLLQTHTHIHILNLYASFKLHGLHLSLSTCVLNIWSGDLKDNPADLTRTCHFSSPSNKRHQLQEDAVLCSKTLYLFPGPLQTFLLVAQK